MYFKSLLIQGTGVDSTLADDDGVETCAWPGLSLSETKPAVLARDG